MYHKIFKLLKPSLPLIPLLLLPSTIPSPQCFFWSSSPQPNTIKNRVSIGLEVSNKPCEDRSAQKQLTNVNGYAVAVFDGHGGWQVSHLCSKIMLQKLQQKLNENKSKYSNQEELIKNSLRDAFQAVQNEYLSVARKGYELGFGRMARAGSCALVCVVANNKIYSANAGDSLGLIVSQNQNKSMNYVQINQQLNANKPEERQRLRKLFPNQQDIVICKKQGESSCYVKGRLQPTRSLGDLRLKHAEFNNPQGFSNDHDYQSTLKSFTGPYITWEPEIKVFNLQKNHKSIVLASDGLWDQLQRQQVAELFKNRKAQEMPKILIECALEKAARDANTTVQGLRDIPEGKKRRLHDDITVVVVDLEGQYRQ